MEELDSWEELTKTNALQAANRHILIHGSLLFTCKQNPERLAKFRWVGTVSISTSTRNFTPLHTPTPAASLPPSVHQKRPVRTKEHIIMVCSRNWEIIQKIIQVTDY
jgi:hypothetical protein